MCGWCTCIAGTSATCNHMIAVLHKVDYTVQNGYNNPACTSIPCDWNQSTRKDVEPSKIIDLNLRRDKASKSQADSEGLINEAWLNFDPRSQWISEQRKRSFLEGLKIKPLMLRLQEKVYLTHGKQRLERLWVFQSYFSPEMPDRCPSGFGPPNKTEWKRHPWRSNRNR